MKSERLSLYSLISFTEQIMVFVCGLENMQFLAILFLNEISSSSKSVESVNVTLNLKFVYHTSENLKKAGISSFSFKIGGKKKLGQYMIVQKSTGHINFIRKYNLT